MCCLLEVVSDAQVMAGDNGQGVIALGHLRKKQCLLMLINRRMKHTVFISETQSPINSVSFHTQCILIMWNPHERISAILHSCNGWLSSPTG